HVPLRLSMITKKTKSTRSDSHVEDPKHDLMADVPGEKSFPSFTQPRPASNITDSGKNQASYGESPSYLDLRTQPASDKEHD
ncbi:hypothetical protein Tco_1520973, partial [Tanacetum coccineum]